MTTSLGRRLAELGLSNSEAADRIATFTDHAYRPDPALVWRWANGEVIPREPTILILVGAFDLDATRYREDLDRVRQDRDVRKSHRRAPRRGSSASPWDLDDSWTDVSRRELVLGGISTIADVTVSGAARRIAGAAGRSDLGNERFRTLGHQIDTIATSYSRLPLDDVEQVLEGQLSEIVDDFERRLTHKQRQKLHHIGAQICALLGRVASATGRNHVARAHYSTAFSLSDQIGDRRLKAWIALEQATLMCEAGAPQEAIDLARAALGVSRGSDRVQALVLIARASASMSDSSQARKYIRLAANTVDAIEPEYDSDRTDALFHAWAASCTFHALGRAALDLGDRDSCRSLAEDAKSAAIQSTSMWQRQNLAHARLVDAGAAALEGDPVLAAALVGQVLDSDPHSAFLMLNQSSSVLERLAPFETTTAVRELRERIAAGN